MIDDASWAARDAASAAHRNAASSAEPPREVTTMRVEFIRAHRGYNVGEIATFDAADAERLMRGGWAVAVDAPQSTTEEEPAVQKPPADKMVKPPAGKRPKPGQTGPGDVVTK